MSTIHDMNVAEVQDFIAEALKGKGSALTRDNLKKSFSRQKVDGKTLVSLTRRKSREYRLGAYGVPKGLRAALVEAVEAALKATSKKVIKGRGKPKFIGRRSVKTPDNTTVRDSALAIARHMAKLDKRNKKTFDKNGWPTIQYIVSEPAEELSAFKSTSSLTQIVHGFRKMSHEQVAAFVKERLGSTVTVKNMVSSIIRYKLNGDALATICMDKSAKRRGYSFAAYRIRTTAAAQLTKLVRSSIDQHDMAGSSKKVNTIRCPDGAVVRDSSVSIAKYMARRYGSEVLRPGLKVHVEKNNKAVEAEVLHKKDGKVQVKFFDFESGTTEWVNRDQVKVTKTKKASISAEDSEVIPWDGTIVLPKSVRRAHEIAKAGGQAPSLATASPEQIGAWAVAKIGGRNGARLASILRSSNMTGAQLVALGGAKKLTGTLNAMAVPFSLRRSLVKALRAEAKNAPKDDESDFAPERFFDGKSMVKMFTGDMVRDSHVAMARYTAVKVEKKAPYIEGFPEFEWVTGGYQPIMAMSVAELGRWVEKTFADFNGKSILVNNLRKFNVDGEAIARICSKKVGVSGRLSAVGVPLSLRGKLVKSIRKATPNYAEPEKEEKLIVCPDGKKVRDSTVAIAKHLRWQRRGYTPRDETEWPEIEIIAHMPPATKRDRVKRRVNKVAKEKLAKKMLAKGHAGIPKDKKRQHKIDSHGWPEIDIVVSKEHKAVKSEFGNYGPQELEMWMREKLGQHVGIKVLSQCVYRNKFSAKSVAEIASDNKHRNARMAAMGVPYSLRKPLVAAIKHQAETMATGVAKTRWIGLNMISMPDGKTYVRDSAVSIGRHFAKTADKKKESAKLANGWPSIKFVTAEDVDEVSSPSHGAMLTMRMQGLVRWAKATFKSEVELKRFTKAIVKYRITGRIIADVANDYKKRSYRLGMYAIPYGLRQQVVRAVLAETEDYTLAPVRKYIFVDGVKVRNSKISMILHMSKTQKIHGEDAVVDVPAEMQPDLLEMDVEEFAAWAEKKLRHSAPRLASTLSAAIIRNGVSSKMFAELALIKKHRNGRMAAFGIPVALRKAFVDLAKRTVPPSARKLAEKRPFVGLKKCKLPTGETVRDSALTIRRTMDRKMNKQMKKTFDKNGWPTIEMVGETKSEEVVQPKPAATVVDKSKGLLIVGKSIIRGSNSEEELLAGLPDDLRKFSIEEVARWVEAKMEDANLARQFIRNRISGLTLAALRDNKTDLVARLNMLGVPKTLRGKLVRAVRREAKALEAVPEPAKYWFSPTGKKVRNSMVAIAAHIYHTTGRVIDQSRSDHVTDFKTMSNQATVAWVSYALSREASGKSAARSLGRLKVSGKRLAYIVGEPSGRNDRLSAYGIPYSTRRPLVDVVKSSVADRTEPVKNNTITCPDGTEIRDSTISMAKWEAREMKVKVAEPDMAVFQPSAAPVLAMRNDEAVSFVSNSSSIADSPLCKSLVKRLQRMRVDGDMLASIAQKGHGGRARALMNMIGVPHSMMKKLVATTRARITEDKKKGFADVYKVAEARNFMRLRPEGETKFKGFSKIKIEGKSVRDSAPAIAAFLGRKHKKTFSHEPQFIFEKTKTAPKEDTNLEQLPYDKVGEWLATKMTNVNQRALTSLAATFKHHKISGVALAEICLRTSGRTSMLASFGIRKSVRQSLVKVVKEAMKDKKVVVPRDIEQKEDSELIKAFKKSMAEGKKSLGWPEIELIHKAPAAKGGFQIIKSPLRSVDRQVTSTIM